MKKMLIYLLFILLFLGGRGDMARAILYQGQLVGMSQYLLQEEILSHRVTLALEIGQLISANQLLYMNPHLLILFGEDGVSSYTLLPTAFMDLYLEQVSLRMGKQVISWGESHYRNPTANFMGYPLPHRISQEGMEGVEAVRLDYSYPEAFTLTGVISWDFSPHLLAAGMIEEELLSIGAPLPLELRIDEPTWKTLKDNQYALRLNIPGAEWDLSFSLFQGYEQYPGLEEEEMERLQRSILTGQPLPSPLLFTYRERRGMGFSLLTARGETRLYLEADFSSNTLEERAWELIMGGSYTRENLQASLEIYHRQVQDALLKIGEEEYLILGLEQSLLHQHTISVKAFMDVTEKSIHLNPQVSLALGDGMQFIIGGWGRGEFHREMILTGEEAYLGLTLFF